MATVSFNTLKFANRLKEAGVPPGQAEAEAEVLAEVLEVNLKDLATKNDLVQLEARIEAKFEKELAPIKADLAVAKWMLGLLLGGVIALVLKAFFLT